MTTQPSAHGSTQAEQIESLRRIAGIRQGVINKLEKRLKLLEGEPRISKDGAK